MSAAMQARRRQPYLEIVALEKGSWTSYSACGIPYLVAGDVASLDDLVVRTPAEFREQRIDVRLRHEVLSIDLAGRSLEVRDHARHRTIPIDFDQLHVATGARPTRPDLPGIDLDHVRGVQTLDDAKALLDHARVARCQSVVVVGGGYIGLEMAEAMVRWGANVTVIESASQLMSTLDPDMAARLLQPMSGMGIDVRLETEVTAFEPGRVRRRGRRCGPCRPRHPRPRGDAEQRARRRPPGATTGARGALVVDRRQRTTLDGVYAAGDCCESRHLVSGRPTHVALGTVATKQGRVAGINLGGGYATFPGVVGTAITKVCTLEIGRTGLTEREAAKEGFEAEAASIDSTTIAGYLPDARPMTIKLVGEKGSGRLLGAQIIGEDRAGQADRHARHRTPRPHARRRADRSRPGLRATVRDHLGSDPHRRPTPRRGLVAHLSDWGMALAPARAALEGDRTLVGRSLCRAYSDLVDGWLAEIVADAEAEFGGGGVALVAVGGYGRAELSLQSDIDVVLLHTGRGDIGALADRVWYPIWDEGLKLGHAVRTMREALALAADDLDTATSLLQVRHLAGRRGPHGRAGPAVGRALAEASQALARGAVEAGPDPSRRGG